MKHLALLTLLLLSACGFQPLYEAGGSSAAMQAHLSGIDVGPIPDRLGQVMRNRLLDRLNPGTSTDYRLDVVLNSETVGLGIRSEDDAGAGAATQEQLTVTAHMRLVSLKDGETVLEEDFYRRTTYDLVLTDFSGLVQKEDSERRLALELAERIHQRLALYFAQSE